MFWTSDEIVLSALILKNDNKDTFLFFLEMIWLFFEGLRSTQNPISKMLMTLMPVNSPRVPPEIKSFTIIFQLDKKLKNLPMLAKTSPIVVLRCLFSWITVESCN